MKTIGIILTPIAGTKSFGINTAYIQYFMKFGKVELINPMNNEVKPLDLLVLPGGADVDPKRYNAEPDFKCGKPNLFLERFDTKVLPKYYEALNTGVVKNIFGICRGFQSIGVDFGNPLVQDFPFESSDYNDRGETVDKMLVGEEKFNINSIHHQGFFTVNDQIEVIGYSQNEGNIECFKVKDKRIWGVQYHPEELFKDKFTPNLIKSILGTKEAKINKIKSKSYKL